MRDERESRRRAVRRGARRAVRRAVRSRRGWGAAVAAVTAGALICGAAAARAEPGPAGSADPGPSALQRDFATAAGEFHVPAGVLMAVAYQQSRWDAHGGRPSTTGNYNVMGLTHLDPAAARDAVGPETDQRGDRGISTGTGTGDPDRTPAGSAPAAPATTATAPAATTPTDAYRTLDAAAALTGLPAVTLRADTRQNLRGGAALLAHYERQADHGALPADPGAWYAAVARFSQSPDTQGAAQYADRVYATLRAGASRVTADGQRVTLAPEPGLVPRTSGLGGLDPVSDTAEGRAEGRAATEGDPTGGEPAADPAPPIECPATLACDFVPAAYAQTDASDKSKYGNYDKANRPADGSAIRYIVIHDTEGGYAGALQSFQNPATAAAPHYVVRSSDGLVTQTVPTKDIAWHAGNYYVNTHSIGIEHEGVALSGASWYTESLYESSAALVRYLADRFGVPLDRRHIIGHDDVPAPQAANIGGMHWDPGPYWDWAHYMDLLGAPLTGKGGKGTPLTGKGSTTSADGKGTRTGATAARTPVIGGEITIDPPFTSANRPPVTGCSPSPCEAQPVSFVHLRTKPSAKAPLISDPVLTAAGLTTGTTQAADVSDKAVAGQTFVVADVRGDWTAIWFSGRKAWFADPGGANAVVGGTARVVTPAGGGAVPVYGRAYPEASAYPKVLADVAGRSTQTVAPLGWTMPAHQAYVADDPVTADYFYAENIDRSAPGDDTRVTGTTVYYPIRWNHRIAYVKASDVTVRAAATAR